MVYVSLQLTVRIDLLIGDRIMAIAERELNEVIPHSRLFYTVSQILYRKDQFLNPNKNTQNKPPQSFKYWLNIFRKQVSHSFYYCVYS